jgi:hypothetical protein
MMIELQLHLRAEDETVGRAAEMEHADLVPFPDPLPFAGSDVAAGNLGQADCKHAHEPDVGAVGLDEQQRARRQLRDVALRIVRACRVKPM